MESTLIFVDDAYLQRICKTFGEGKYLKYDKINFFNKIAGNQNLICEKIFYYVAPPFCGYDATTDEKRRLNNYNKFVKKMRKLGIEVCEGECQRIKENGIFVYRQKGIDVLLAIDFVSVPLKMKVDKVILIAADSDFVPAVKRLEEFGVKTILYTFYEKKRGKRFSTSNNLIKSVWKYVKLKREDFEDG